MENGNMTPLVPRQDGRLEWGNGVVSMLFDIAADSPVSPLQRCRAQHGSDRWSLV